MGIMVYSLLWVMQDFVHQPYHYYHHRDHRRHHYYHCCYCEFLCCSCNPEPQSTQPLNFSQTTLTKALLFARACLASRDSPSPGLWGVRTAEVGSCRRFRGSALSLPTPVFLLTCGVHLSTRCHDVVGSHPPAALRPELLCIISLHSLSCDCYLSLATCC